MAINLNRLIDADFFDQYGENVLRRFPYIFRDEKFRFIPKQMLYYSLLNKHFVYFDEGITSDQDELKLFNPYSDPILRRSQILLFNKDIQNPEFSEALKKAYLKHLSPSSLILMNSFFISDRELSVEGVTQKQMLDSVLKSPLKKCKIFNFEFKIDAILCRRPNNSESDLKQLIESLYIDYKHKGYATDSSFSKYKETILSLTRKSRSVKQIEQNDLIIQELLSIENLCRPPAMIKRTVKDIFHLFK